MWLLEFPINHETRFYTLAFFLSFVFGVRGIAIKIHEVRNENITLKKAGFHEWNGWQRLLVHYFQDFVYNFVGSLAGWVAFNLLSFKLFVYGGPGVPAPPPSFILDQPNLHLVGWTDLSLAVSALLGITGKLPQTVEGFILSIGKAVETVTGKLAK